MKKLFTSLLALMLAMLMASSALAELPIVDPAEGMEFTIAVA